MLSLAQIVAGILALTLASPTTYECIVVGGKWPEYRPLRVQGRLCGRAIIVGQEDLDLTRLNELPIKLFGRDTQDKRVLATTTVANGFFAFPNVPPAVYRIEWLEGFGRTTEIEVTSEEDGTCSMPLNVEIRLPDECDWYSHVSLQRRTGAR